jgi:hypothetical protein
MLLPSYQYRVHYNAVIAYSIWNTVIVQCILAKYPHQYLSFVCMFRDLHSAVVLDLRLRTGRFEIFGVG